MQASLTAFYKGFIYFTLPFSARQRAASLRKFSSFAAAAHLTSAYALQVACVQFFKEVWCVRASMPELYCVSFFKSHLLCAVVTL